MFAHNDYKKENNFYNTICFLNYAANLSSYDKNRTNIKTLKL